MLAYADGKNRTDEIVQVGKRRHGPWLTPIVYILFTTKIVKYLRGKKRQVGGPVFYDDVLQRVAKCPGGTFGSLVTKIATIASCRGAHLKVSGRRRKRTLRSEPDVLIRTTV